jgi:hypothetical protein
MRMPMSTEFLYEQELDIIPTQGVTPNEFDLIRAYITYTNVGINKCGNMMLQERE